MTIGDELGTCPPSSMARAWCASTWRRATLGLAASGKPLGGNRRGARSEPFLLRIERAKDGKLVGVVHPSAVKEAMAAFQFPPENRVGATGWLARLEVELREQPDGPVLP